MTWFEVFIPAKDANAMNVTLTVEAPNWIGALRAGLNDIGEGQDAISNVMCDIKEDNSIHVTNPNTSRVFRLREVDGPPAEPAAAPAPAEPAATEPTAPQAAAPAPISIPDAAPAEPEPAPAAAPPEAKTEPAAAKISTEVANAETVPAGTPRPAPEPAPAAETKAKKPAKKERKKEKAPPPKRTTGQFNAAPKPTTREVTAPQPSDPKIAPAASRDKRKINLNDVIADIFDATQDLLMEATVDASKVANTLLDIAMDQVPADAGTFYLADINGSELVFEAVRGPKADAIKKSKITVPVGQGIVGFAAQEGVCLVIQDMKHDKRYFSAVADAVGYQPHDTLCASAEKEGRLFGAIQLINSKDGGFSPDEMEVVRYIGLTAADMLERAADQKL